MDIMFLLHGEALINVYSDFKQVYDTYDRGMLLKEFVVSVLKHVDLSHADVEPPALVRQLIELFKQIDINDDKTLEWSEFTGFCVEAGMAATGRRTQRSTFSFAHDARFVDHTTRGNSIREVRYHPSIDAVVVLEGDSKCVRIYTPRMKLARTIDAGFAIRRSRRHLDTAVTITHEVIKVKDSREQCPRMIAVLLSNYVIGLWGFTQTDCPFKGILPRISIEHAPCSLHWDNNSQLLWVGCTNGHIWGYDCVHKRQVAHLTGHDDVILSMASLGRSESLYTSGLDGKLLLWDFTGGRRIIRKTLKTEHGAVQKVVYVDYVAMLYGLTNKNCILGWDTGSADISVRIDGGKISRFVDFTTVDFRPSRMLTIDDQNTLRVWDIGNPVMGTCFCLHTIVLDALRGFSVYGLAITSAPNSRPAGAGNRDAVLPPPLTPAEKVVAEAAAAAAASRGENPREYDHSMGIIGDLILATGRLHRFSSVALERIEPPAALLYNSTLLRFISAVGKDVSTWDCDSGKLVETFSECLPFDATALCFDDRQRKLFCGTASGEIATINLSNGSLMKSGRLHTGAITEVIYDDKQRCIVSGSNDGSIVVFDDEPQAELDPMRSVTYAHDCDITALSYSHELSLIITGDRNGCCKVWDFQDLKLVAIFNEHRALVTAIATFKAYPFFVSADADGQLIVTTLRTTAHPFQRLYSFRNSVVFTELVDPEATLHGVTGVSAAAEQLRAQSMGSLRRRRGSVTVEKSPNGGAASSAGSKPTTLASVPPITLNSSSGLKSTAATASASKSISSSSGSGYDEKELAELLDQKGTLGAVIEQLLIEKAAQRDPDTARASAGRRRPNVRVLYALRNDDDKGVKPNDRFLLKEKTVDTSVTSLKGVIVASSAASSSSSAAASDVSRPTSAATVTAAAGTPGAAGKDTILLCMGDDSGRIKVIDLSPLLQRMKMIVPLPQSKQPSHQVSYTSRRRTHRDDPGPVITDEYYFYRDEEEAAKEIEMQAQSDAGLVLAIEKAVRKASVVGNAIGAFTGSAARAPSANAAPAAAPAAAASGVEVPAASTAASLAHGNYPDSSDESDTNEGLIHVEVETRPPSLAQRRASLVADGMQRRVDEALFAPLSGPGGIGTATAAERRSKATAQIMRRRSIEAGVSGTISAEITEALRQMQEKKEHQRGALAAKAVTSVHQNDKNGGSNGKNGRRRESQVQRGDRRGSLADWPALPGDIVELRRWNAHEGAVVNLVDFDTRQTSAAQQDSSTEGSAADPLASLFLATCGADARMFVWDCEQGVMSGQLGRVPADEEAIALGRVEPAQWRFPPSEAARTTVALAEAGDVLTDVSGSIGARHHAYQSQHKTTAPAPLNRSGTASGSVHQLPGSTRALGATASALDDYSQASSNDATSRSQAPSIVMVSSASSAALAAGTAEARPGHSLLEAQSMIESLSVSDERLMRDGRLVEAMPRAKAKNMQRRLSTESGVHVPVPGLDNENGSGAASSGGQQSYDFSPATAFARSVGKSAGQLDDQIEADEEAAAVALAEEMLEPDELARLANDDKAALRADDNEPGTAAANAAAASNRAAVLLGKPSGQSHKPSKRAVKRIPMGDTEITNQSVSSASFDFVLSALSPTAVAADALGPAAVAVLALTGYDASALAATRAIKKTARAVQNVASSMALESSDGHHASSTGQLTSSSPGTCMTTRNYRDAVNNHQPSSSPQQQHHHHQHHQHSSSSIFDVVKNELQTSALTFGVRSTIDLTDVSASLGALAKHGGVHTEAEERIVTVDTATALALVSAIGGVQPRVPENLKKIAAGYTNLDYEKARARGDAPRTARSAPGSTSKQDPPQQLSDTTSSQLQPSFKLLAPHAANARSIDSPALQAATARLRQRRLSRSPSPGEPRHPASSHVASPISSSPAVSKHKHEAGFQHRMPSTAAIKASCSSSSASASGAASISKADKIMMAVDLASGHGHVSSSSMNGAPSSADSGAQSNRVSGIDDTQDQLDTLLAGFIRAPLASHSSFGRMTPGRPGHGSGANTNGRSRPGTRGNATGGTGFAGNVFGDLQLGQLPKSDVERRGVEILSELAETQKDPEKRRLAIGRALRPGSVTDDEDEGEADKDDRRNSSKSGSAGGDGGDKDGGKGSGSADESPGVMPARFGPYSALDVMRVRRIFDRADADGSGDVDLDELMSSNEWKRAYSPDALREMFAAMDGDASGRVTADELFKVIFPKVTSKMRRSMIKWTDPKARTKIQHQGPKRAMNLKQKFEAEEIFDALDVDRDGYITVAELREMVIANGTKQEKGTWSLKDINNIVEHYARESAASSSVTTAVEGSVAAGSSSGHLQGGMKRAGTSASLVLAKLAGSKLHLKAAPVVKTASAPTPIRAPAKPAGQVMDRASFIKMMTDNIFDVAAFTAAMRS